MIKLYDKGIYLLNGREIAEDVREAELQSRPWLMAF